MKTLKLLNKKNLSIIIISLLSTFSTIAEDKPVDIWNIDKKEAETSAEKAYLKKKKMKHQRTVSIKCRLIKI
jgi:hypothetical protein